MKETKQGTIPCGDKDVHWEAVTEAESRLKVAEAKRFRNYNAVV